VENLAKRQRCVGKRPCELLAHAPCRTTPIGTESVLTGVALGLEIRLFACRRLNGLIDGQILQFVQFVQAWQMPVPASFAQLGRLDKKAFDTYVANQLLRCSIWSQMSSLDNLLLMGIEACCSSNTYRTSKSLLKLCSKPLSHRH
jgi:hypothetical protein